MADYSAATRAELEVLRQAIDTLHDSVANSIAPIPELIKGSTLVHGELHALKVAMQLVLNTLGMVYPELRPALRENFAANQASLEFVNQDSASLFQLFRDSLGSEPPKPPKLYVVPQPNP